MQSYTEISENKTIKESRELLLNNDKTAISNSSGTSAPSSPMVGQSFYNSSTKKLYVYDGSSWIEYLPSNSVIPTGGIRTITPLQINPTNCSNYSEGLRIGTSSGGWSNINFGCKNDATNGTQSGQWLVGRRGSNGTKAGAIGDFVIEHNNCVGTGLTLFANGNAPAWNGTTISLSNHTHSYIPLSGGTITGNISKKNSGAYWCSGRSIAPFRTIAATNPVDAMYSPVWSAKTYQGSWDCGPYTSNILHLSYITDANFNSNNNTQTADFTWETNGTFNAKTLKQSGSVVSVNGHTHNYAGSSSAGGAATSANKLNTNAGSATTPVYFSNGVPVACTNLNAISNSLPITRILNGGGTKLYSCSGGLDNGNITLSQAFTNFKHIVIFASEDSTSRRLRAFEQEAASLWAAISGNATYWPGNTSVSNSDFINILIDIFLYWYIYNAKGGSSTTFLKYYSDNCRIYSVYGIN